MRTHEGTWGYSNEKYWNTFAFIRFPGTRQNKVADKSRHMRPHWRNVLKNICFYGFQRGHMNTHEAIWSHRDTTYWKTFVFIRFQGGYMNTHEAIWSRRDKTDWQTYVVIGFPRWYMNTHGAISGHRDKKYSKTHFLGGFEKQWKRPLGHIREKCGWVCEKGHCKKCRQKQSWGHIKAHEGTLTKSIINNLFLSGLGEDTWTHMRPFEATGTKRIQKH